MAMNVNLLSSSRLLFLYMDNVFVFIFILSIIFFTNTLIVGQAAL